MAKFVFKLKNLGVDPDIIRTFNVGDPATIRALDRLRVVDDGLSLTNEQLLLRLWTEFMTTIVNADYLARKNPALVEAAAGITKLVPSVDVTET